MINKDANPHKARGTDSNAKPAVIHLVNGETIDAPDHDTDGSWCIVYQEQRPGVAMKIPREAILYIDRIDDREDDEDDGGRDIPACTCGADLIETAELDTELAPVAGEREPFPVMNEAPSATCAVCGEPVGALYGMEAVRAVWEARGEPLPGRNGGDGRW